MRQLKTKQQYKRELNILIKEYSKIDKKVKKMKIDMEKYYNNPRYRSQTNRKIKNYEKALEASRKLWPKYQKENRDRLIEKYKKRREENKQHIKDYTLKYNTENREIIRERCRKFRESHPWIVKKHFEKWTINNPRKAMLCAAASSMTRAIINKLWIRPTVCPHCGREHCLIDFHHPNHLFWWKWTFCCKSCHYYFNRGKVPASDTIIDLKKLLRESNSH